MPAAVRVLLGLLACWAASSTTAAPSSEQSKQLLDCYKQGATWEPGTFDGFLRGEVARLQLHKLYWSRKPLPGADQGPLTLGLFTAATISRLDTLSAMCRSWSGLLSAAVYVPLAHNTSGTELSEEAAKALSDATTLTRQLFVRMEAESGSCVLRMLLLFEPLADELLFRLLPINSLRNAALLAVDTPLTAMVDVDLLPSAQLSSLLTTNRPELERIAQLCQQKKMVVMPAFETPEKAMSVAAGQLVSSDLAAGGQKSDIVNAVQAGKIIPFALRTYIPGHNATDYTRWYQSSQDYAVAYQINYEPWYIVERQAMTLYDSRFRGYGWNKVTQVAHQHASGFEFIIHPTLFLVHRAHMKSDAHSLYHNTANSMDAAAVDDAAASLTSQSSTQPKVGPAKLVHRRVAALRHVVIKQMYRGVYVNINDTSVAGCMKSLPWWQAGT